MVESSRTMVGEQTGDAPVRDRSNLMLLVLCSAAFMAMLDVFVVSVAFAAIGEGYPGSSLADLSLSISTEIKSSATADRPPKMSTRSSKL